MAKITAAFRVSAMRRGIVVKTKTAVKTDETLRNAAVLEMANLGFLVRPDSLVDMSIANLELMLADARKVIGADRHMKPIYPGFPQQVETLPTLTLLVEQILHYMTGGTFLPDYPELVREGLPLQDMIRRARPLEVLEAAPAARGLARKLATDPIALSVDDRALLNGCLELQHPSLADVADVSAAARNGENMQSYVESVFAVSSFSEEELLAVIIPNCDNSDQLLRVVLSLFSLPSNGKWNANYVLAVSTLADRHARAVRMNRMSRRTRRQVIQRVGELSEGFKADRLVARQNLWRGVMRAVHPYDFKLSDASLRAANIVHSNIEYRTLNSLVESAMASGDVNTAVTLMAKYQPGNLLRRLVALLRLVNTSAEIKVLATALRERGADAALTTIISAYNGVLSANDESVRITRVAGLNNTLVERAVVKKVDSRYVTVVLAVLREVMRENLKGKPAPQSAVGNVSTQPVPLVRRDASTSDRVLDRGEVLNVVGKGETLRVFGHWNNNQASEGYMDIGIVILDEGFKMLTVSTWDSWGRARNWSTYSGDKLVSPGDSAAEYLDVKLEKLKQAYPESRYLAMTVQSWSGWPIDNVDFIAGVMLRGDAQKGKVFEPRTIETAFHPTTSATQAVPFAVDLKEMKMVWLDSSNGSTAAHVSSSYDDTVGQVVYDEYARPRLTMGELVTLWAEAHGVTPDAQAVDRGQVLALLA